MGNTVQQVIKAMEEIAPPYLAESWDNVGLLLGGSRDKVKKVMVCLDVTESVAHEAIQKGVDMIISHHPIIFGGLNSVRNDVSGQRILCLLIRHNIAVYCAHTNLDKAPGGVDDTLACRLGLEDIKPLTFDKDYKLIKIVVYIPRGHENAVMDAMTQAGAGWIGNYSHCTFQTKGVGTFMPLAGTTPYIGRQGSLEKVKEIRLETIAPSNKLDDIVDAMLNAHPYEEVAYDLYPLANEVKVPGVGRMGKLPEKMSFKDLAVRVRTALKTPVVYCIGEEDRGIQVVATCAGAGSSLIEQAHLCGAQVFVTGELKYHDAQTIKAMGMSAICAGHFATEVIIVDGLTYRLQMAFNDLQYKIEVISADTMADCFSIVGE
jgi:dinuclear metal center YbgI/SA1388 family protein